MRLEVSGPDEVTVQGPELFAGREGSDEMQVLVEGLLKIKVFKKGHWSVAAKKNLTHLKGWLALLFLLSMGLETYQALDDIWLALAVTQSVKIADLSNKMLWNIVSRNWLERLIIGLSMILWHKSKLGRYNPQAWQEGAGRKVVGSNPAGDGTGLKISITVYVKVHP